MGQIGITVEEMEVLGQEFNRQAEAAASLRNAITSKLGQTNWLGGAAERFRSEWDGSFSPGLQKLEQALQELGREVEQRRQAFVQAGG